MELNKDASASKEKEFEKVSIDDVRQFLTRRIKTYEYKMIHSQSRVTFAKYRNELAVFRSMLFYLDIRYSAKREVQSGR
jgi:hypothetical protein